MELFQFAYTLNHYLQEISESLINLEFNSLQKLSEENYTIGDI